MMPRIVFQNGQHQGMSVEVDKVLSLGRDLSCDVHLVSPDVSRVHCRVFPQDKAFFIEDAKSRNGSFVNGNQIQKYSLNHGDMICLGDLVLRFELNELLLNLFGIPTQPVHANLRLILHFIQNARPPRRKFQNGRTAQSPMSNQHRTRLF